MGIGFLNHHTKKGSKMVVMMDLDQNLFPSIASFDVSFCFHRYILCGDVNWCRDQYYHHHLRGEGGGVFIKEFHNSHACNDCNGSTIN